jgi:hypothetical protein
MPLQEPHLLIRIRRYETPWGRTPLVQTAKGPEGESFVTALRSPLVKFCTPFQENTMRPPFDFENMYEKLDQEEDKTADFAAAMIGLCIFFGFLLVVWLRS